MSRRRHWMDQVVDEVREQIRLAVPVVAEQINDAVPFGYEPPNQADEIKEFLLMPPEARRQKFLELGPQAYSVYTTRMMSALTARFGPAAQRLFPLLQAVPLEQLASGEETMDPHQSLSAAVQDLRDKLGIPIMEIL